MDVENCTSDDAIVKVTGGPGTGTPSKSALAQESWQKDWPLPSKQKLSLSSLPDNCVIHFYVEVGSKVVGSDAGAAKDLKLTRNGNGYKVQAVGNGRRGKP
jgi:hypothetical protein